VKLGSGDVACDATSACAFPLEGRPAAAEASQAISDLRERPATLKSSIFSALLLF